MKQINITKNEEGQRLDKFLFKHLGNASSGFIFKMLRKKNIELNHKKACGTEILKANDEIYFFLSDETYDKFVTIKDNSSIISDTKKNDKSCKMPPIVFEDDNILLINKPTGMLSQKASKNDVSANEICIKYLYDKGELNAKSSSSFKPSICNRLDRNTSGILIFAKTYDTAKQMALALKNRTIHKYYTTIVCGHLNKEEHIRAYLFKDEKTNKVHISSTKINEQYSFIETKYKAIDTFTSRDSGEDYTLLEVELLTGKSHQIRAHLSYIGFPILGDNKYGNRITNKRFKNIKLSEGQLLCSSRLIMPDMLNGEIAYLAGREFIIEPNEVTLFYNNIKSGNI